MVRRSQFGEWAAALAVMLLGLYLAIGTVEISFGSGYDRIGPRFFPFLVAAGLLILGALLLFSAWRDRKKKIPSQGLSAPGRTLNWRGLGYLALSLLVGLSLLERGGFVVSAVLLFVLVARAFQSRRPVRDAMVGALFIFLVYVAFTKGLGLALPSGILGWIF